MEQYQEWSVTCKDVAGRSREVTVMVNEGRIVLVCPPGELALFDPLEIGRLRAALQEAAVAASSRA
jgi:hypothetical protein